MFLLLCLFLIIVFIITCNVYFTSFYVNHFELPRVWNERYKYTCLGADFQITLHMSLNRGMILMYIVIHLGFLTSKLLPRYRKIASKIGQNNSCQYTLHQCFSIPVLGTPCSAHFACLPYLTHLIELISLLGGETWTELTSWWSQS